MVVDTDVIIRFVTRDDEGKAERFEKYLVSKKPIIITDITCAEVYWTLRFFYKSKKVGVLNALESLINTSNVSSNYEVLSQAIATLRNHNTSFGDAYIASFAKTKGKGEVLSFDRGFNKLPGIKRKEP